VRRGSSVVVVSPALTTISRSTTIAAPPEAVWELVSDLPAMGAFSPENTGGSWVGGATGPAVGASFRGHNGAGRRRWSTRSTVVRSEPGRAFAFDVAAAGMPVAQWSYELEPTAHGCRLTETWTDRRGRLMVALGRLTTGVSDRAAFTGQSIEHTLARVKVRAELDRQQV
jgi:uncharacterized protein YndB with AHSA1/START domain